MLINRVLSIYRDKDRNKYQSDIIAICDRINSVLELLSISTYSEWQPLYGKILKQNLNSLRAIMELPNKQRCSDSTKEDDIIVEISIGVGGEESKLFAKEVYDMYNRFLSSKGNKILFKRGDEHKLIIEASGQHLLSLLKYENGVHRVQRVPKTEKSGRLHTSSIGVFIMSKRDRISIDMAKRRLKIETMRSSGKGGQHVNKTESAVRITDLDTGISVHYSTERSQHKNQEIALNILKEKLEHLGNQCSRNEVGILKSQSLQNRDRSVKIRTYNFSRNQITQHLINKTYDGLEDVLYKDGLMKFLEYIDIEV